MKPNLYLAGKISKDDYRHSIVPGLRGHEWRNGPITTALFDYVGPFFRACDHGCFHSRNSHGAVNQDGCAGDGDSKYTQLDVIRNNNAAMDSADVVFCYITSPDCYGTLVEIGRATGRQSPPRIAIAFAPGMPADDFWYSTFQVDAVYHDVREQDLPSLIEREVSAFISNRSEIQGVQ